MIKNELYAPYMGTHLVLACPMTDITFCKLYENRSDYRFSPALWGYRVLFPGGFKLWESAKLFTETYRKVTDLEKNLFEKIKGQSEVK